VKYLYVPRPITIQQKKVIRIILKNELTVKFFLFATVVGLIFCLLFTMINPGNYTIETEAKTNTGTIPSRNPETATRIIITAETYLEIYSPPRAYHEDPYYVYGTLYEKGGSLDVGAPNCPLHIYWGVGPGGVDFSINTSADQGNEGYFRMPIPVNQSEGTYPMFFEFRGQVIINETRVYEYDPTNETLDPKKNNNSVMSRYPTNFTIDVDVYYHSFIDASISTNWISAGESFWINGSLSVYETGEPIPNARMNITKDTKKIGEIRSSLQGKFNEKLRLMNSTAPGPHKIRLDFWQFHFDENANYGSSYTTFDVHFIQKVVMDYSITPPISGGKIYINGTTRDLRGEVLSDPSVPDKIYIMEGEIANTTEGDTYDLDGVELLNGTIFNFTSVLPKNFPSGLATVKLSFNKDNLYADGESIKEVMVTTSLSVEIDSFSFSSPVENVSGQVIDSGGRGFSVQLSAYINGIEVGFGSSDANGHFRFQISLTEEIGIGSVNVLIEATPTYRSLAAEENIEVDVYYSALSLSDLVVNINNIEIDYARPGDGSGLLNVTYIISNDGNVASQSCQVLLRSSPALEKYVFLDSIPPGKTVAKDFKWAVRDNITLDIFVDPEGIVREIDEDNNIISIQLETELYDLDGDGDYNYYDEDTDGDGFSNDDENSIHTDPLDPLDNPDDPKDEDSDGMADTWELFYGLDSTDPTDALIDTDNDGFSNLEEYESHTSPDDIGDYPDVEIDNNDVKGSQWWTYIIGLIVVIGIVVIITLVLKKTRQE